MKKRKDEFVTDLYCKATDCHQYLRYDSCYPDHMKKLSVSCQGLRIKRLCSDRRNLQKHLENRKSRKELLRPKVIGVLKSLL